MTCPTVTLGSLVMDGATPDANGTIWTVTALPGWHDTTGMRSATAEAQPVGELITVARENARAIALEVTAATAKPFATKLGDVRCFEAVETLKAAGRCVLVPTLMLVTDPVLAAQALVRRVGPIKTSMQGNFHSMHFLVPLLAPDPRRYRQSADDDTITLAIGASTLDQTVTTAGDVDTPFVATLRGPATNPKILSHELGTPTSRPFLQWIGVLADNTHHVVFDTGAGTVTKDGSDASAGLAPGSQMFDLIPGGNFLTVSRTGSTAASMTSDVSRHDAFD